MNKIILLIITFCLSTSAFSQEVLETHFQGYIPGEYYEGKSYSTFDFSNYYSYVEYDIEKKEFTTINDSLPKNLDFYHLNGDTGYARSSSNQDAYISYDGFKTLTKIDNQPRYLSVTKTNTGYLGHNYFTSSISSLYYSNDGVTWTPKHQVSNSAYPKATIKVIDDTVYAFNNTGSIVYSADGGETFQSKSLLSGTTKSIEVILYQSSKDTVFFKSTGNEYYYTFNFFKTITKLPVTSYAPIYVPTIDSIYSKSGNQIHLSLDTGKTYTPVGSALPNNASLTISNGRFYLLAEPNAYKASSILGPWEKINAANPGGFLSIDIKDNFILAGQNGAVLVSKDGGKEFSRTLMTGIENLSAVKIVNNDLWLAADGGSNIYLSTDQGETWTKKYNSGNFMTLPYKFSVASDLSSIILLSEKERPLISTDQGKTWTKTGIIGGDGQVLNNGKLLFAFNIYELNSNNDLEEKISLENIDKSTGSRSQLLKFPVDGYKAFHLTMANDNEGYLFAYNSTNIFGSDAINTRIYFTNDGWQSYTTQSTTELFLKDNLSGNFPTIKYISGDTLVVYVANRIAQEDNTDNKIYLSTDGGKNWEVKEYRVDKYDNTSDNMLDMYFTSASHFIGGTNLRIVRNIKPINYKTSGFVLNNLDSKKSISMGKVYPNPTTGKFTITTSDAHRNLNISLYSVDGRLLKESTVNNMNSFNYEIEGPKGVYFLKIINNKSKEAETIKVIRK